MKKNNNFEKTDVFESQNKKKYTSLKFWISDYSNVSPADNVSMSFSVEFFEIFAKLFQNDLVRIMTEFYAWRKNSKFEMTMLVMRSDQPMRF